MRRVRIFCGWRDPSFFLAWNGLCRNMTIVDDDSYDCAILINTPRPALKAGLPRSQVLGATFEPQQRTELRKYSDYCQQYVGRYLCTDARGLPRSIFVEHHSYMGTFCWTPEMLRKISTPKSRPMSMVAGRLQSRPGHRLRKAYIGALLGADLAVDVYGRNLKQWQGHPRIKGGYPSTARETPYAAYRFVIAIESCREPQYISEKFSMPILMRTVPVYWGCPQIEAAYGPGCFIHLPKKVGRGVKRIQNIIASSTVAYKKAQPKVEALRSRMLSNDNLLGYAHHYFAGKE